MYKRDDASRFTLPVHHRTSPTRTTMYPHHSPNYTNAVSSCYFSIVVPASSAPAHFSTETPNITPVSGYSAHTFADPVNPLLSYRQVPLEYMPPPADASRLLQLQTSAAHRPTAEPLQYSGSSSSSSSASSDSTSLFTGSGSSRSSLSSPSVLSCCRCRRESLMGMIQFSTNIYYCSHCARMVGYSAG
jgi:hypothetical protein